MFLKGYTPDEHGVGKNNIFVTKMDSDGLVRRWDMKVGKNVRKMMNACIETEGRRKAYANSVVEVSSMRAFQVSGSRYLLNNSFYNEYIAGRLPDYFVDQLFANDGSTVSFYTRKDESDTVIHGFIKSIFHAVVKHALTNLGVDEKYYSIKFEGKFDGSVGLEVVQVYNI